METNYDVLVIGAGLSGISMACHLQMECPGKRVGVLERRQAIGGTWDLFRYPGIRSDSDMFTFGFRFRPWHDLKVLADGPSIRRYVTETAREYGIDRKIVFGVRTTEAAWSSEHRRWTVSAIDEQSGEPRTFTCNYLVSCTGYYNHDAGYLPAFPGVERFQGRCIHPQKWPEELDYRGKRVVVIGSGATAVTLVPTMARDTAHITMLQRSPSYVFSVPAYDAISAALKRVLPERWVYAMARKRNLFLQRAIYKASRRWPGAMRSWLLSGVRKHVGKDFDMAHFSPRYMPWDERLCAVPDADLFKAIRDGKASIVTDHIDTFTETGIRLKSGRELQADIIVTATGLQLQSFGGMQLVVDGHPRAVNELMTYKGVLLQDVPNMAWLFGYINAPWTLKVDMASSYFCRLLNHMEQNGSEVVTPRAPAWQMLNENIVAALKSGYAKRGEAMVPRQGRTLPWRVLHNPERDQLLLMKEPVQDAALEFRGGPMRAPLRSAVA
ncbi:flavin-containing monooxygenase [Variovorax sp. GT1P44]|uniref:flavin-containing monooxygenase n=1 Tax=Variovorax sp. GT1P44 TaxID=3443742 RepID=UPI003F45A4B0